MDLPEGMTVWLLAGPGEETAGEADGLQLVHMDYRVGSGPHLFCARYPLASRGGLMALDHQGFDGLGGPEPLCKEILSECAGRNFAGVFCDFEGDVLPVLRQAVLVLCPTLSRQGKVLYLPPAYGQSAPPEARVVIPASLTAGSLRQTLEEAVAQYGAGRVAVGLERLAEDYTLPAAGGAARRLTRQELTGLLRERAPAVYFSDELYAHYFTYMRPGESAHYVLYDDAASLMKKLRIAADFGIREAFLPYGQAGELLRCLADKRKAP